MSFSVLGHTASPEVLSAGQDTVLAWDVGSVAPNTMWLEGLPYEYEVYQPEESVTTPVYETTTFTLHVENDVGVAKRSVTVTVE